VAAAELILIGTVESVVPLDEPTPIPHDELDLRSLAVTVSVGEYLKGSGPDTIVHVEPSSGLAACQLNSQVGVSYLLFLDAPDEQGRFQTSFCAGSGAPDSELVAEVRAILAGPEPTPQIDVLPPTGSVGGEGRAVDSWFVAAAVAVAAAALLSLAASALVGRRR
jgi:hypothetical protein